MDKLVRKATPAEFIRVATMQGFVVNLVYLGAKLSFYEDVFQYQCKPIAYKKMVGFTTGDVPWIRFLDRDDEYHYLCPRVHTRNVRDSYVNVPRGGPHSSIEKFIEIKGAPRLWIAAYIENLNICIYIPLTHWHRKLGKRMYISQDKIRRYTFENTLLKLWEGVPRKRRMIYNDVL